jgi:hypothetical protein
MRYVEDETGQMIDGHKAGAIRKMARSIWAAFAQHGKAPAKWSQADIVVLQSYRREMRQHFPELRLCENDWKSEQIAIDNYPSWRTHHLGTDKSSIKQESSNSSGVDLLRTSPPTKRSQHHNEQTFFPATKKAHFESEQPAIDAPSMGDGNSQPAGTSVGTTKDTAQVLKVYIIRCYCSPTNQVYSTLI